MSDTRTQEVKKPKILPKPNSDFYQTFQMLSEAEQAKVLKVREFMETAVAPIINDFWARDEFPFDIVPGIRELQIAGLGYEGYECAGGSSLLSCYVAIAHWPPSMVSTAALRWDPFTYAVRRSKRKSGCRRWLGWKRSGPSV